MKDTGEMADAPDVPHPEQLVGSRAVINAASGGGKTYALRRILEETHGTMQHLVLDVEDELYTLRERFDYVLIGGWGADAPIAEETAGDLALSLLEMGVSAILQLNDCGGLAVQRRIIGAFVAGLMRAPRALWHPVLVAVDEAARYAPQAAPVPSSEPLTNLATAGRKRGFGALFATQRLSMLAKDVLGQCPNRIMGRVDQALDRRAAADLLGFLPSAEEAKGLMRLRHEFWVVGPAFAPEPRLHRFAPSQTTHLQPGKRDVPAPPTSERVRAMLGRLAELAEQSAAEGGDAAPDANAGRRRAIGKGASGAAADERDVQAQLEEARLAAHEAGVKQGYVSGLADGRRLAFADARVALERVLDDAGDAMDRALTAMQAARPRERAPSTEEVPGIPTTPPVSISAPSNEGRKTDMAGALGKPQQRVLDALAWFEAAGIGEPGRHQVGWAAGYRADTGHFGNILSDLAGAGLIERRGGALALTDGGRAAASVPEGRLTPDVMVARIKAKVSGPAARILDVLLEAWPRPVRREAIAEATGYRADTGHFGNLISELCGPEIAVRSGRGEVRVADWVMLKG